MIEKWGLEGESVSEGNLRYAASSYARIKIQNRSLKWITFLAILYLFVVLGLMIASVVIGVNISKDMKVNGDTLVQKNNQDSTLLTSVKYYSVQITLDSSLEQIQGLKELRFITLSTDNQKSYFNFKIVSFFYIKGNKLELYGHTHMANLLPDGNFELIPIVSINGKKSYDLSQKVVTQDVTTTAINILRSNLGITQITNCDQLKQMRKGFYALTVSNLECTLDQPIELLEESVFMGRGNTLQITMNRPNSPACLFNRIFNSRIHNLNLVGDFTGSQLVAPIACEAQLPVKLVKVASYSNLNLNFNGDENIVGGLIGKVLAKDPTSSLPYDLYLKLCVAQNHFNPSNIEQATGIFYQGGYFGVSIGDIDQLNSFNSFSFNLYYNPLQSVHEVINSTDLRKTTKNNLAVKIVYETVGRAIFPHDKKRTHEQPFFPECFTAFPYAGYEHYEYCFSYYIDHQYIPDQYCDCNYSWFYSQLCYDDRYIKNCNSQGCAICNNGGGKKKDEETTPLQKFESIRMQLTSIPCE